MRKRQNSTRAAAEPAGPDERDSPQLRLGPWSIPLPRSRAARIATGSALMVGGVFSFLPVLGLWMLPAGALVLSADSARIRRLRRLTEVKWGKWRRDAK